MAGVQPRAVVVADRWTGGPHRAGVHLLVFHSNDGRSDASDGFTAVGRSSNLVVESQFRASCNRAGGVGGGVASLGTLSSTARLAGAPTRCVDDPGRHTLS